MSKPAVTTMRFLGMAIIQHCFLACSFMRHNFEGFCHPSGSWEKPKVTHSFNLTVLSTTACPVALYRLNFSPAAHQTEVSSCMTPENLHRLERSAVFLLFTHNSFFFFSPPWMNSAVYDYNEITLRFRLSCSWKAIRFAGTQWKRIILPAPMKTISEFILA